MGFWDLINQNSTGFQSNLGGISNNISNIRDKTENVLGIVEDYANEFSDFASNPFDYMTSYINSSIGSLLSSFGSSVPNLIDYVNDIFSDNGVMNHFYKLLYRDFNPDINGFTLIFMVPPDLSGLGSVIQDSTVNLIPFAALDFTPPQYTVNTENINTRSGAIPFATEVAESGQCSVTFIENASLDIYKFHLCWVNYIFDLLSGRFPPADIYIDGQLSGHLDYTGSIYVVRYRQDMKTITMVGKSVGVFPQGLPSKEVIGSRTTNDLTTLPYNYFCAAYREYVQGSGVNRWILDELNQLIISRF